MATILPFHVPLSPHVIDQAVASVQAGGVLAIPTDSYYALAVGVFQPVGLESLSIIKDNREHKPFPVLIADPSQLNHLIDELPEIVRTLIQEFWPGLFTVVLKATPHISPLVLNESGMIGVRQPNDFRLWDLLQRTGPLTGTSANLSGRPPAQSVEEVIEQVGSEIDLILDGGSTPGGQPSTVLQLDPEPRILRQGAISMSAIQQVLAKNSL